MKKADFINFLKETLLAVESDDSAEGRISYEWGEELDTFNVDAFVRIGSSQGQGGCLVVKG